MLPELYDRRYDCSCIIVKELLYVYFGRNEIGLVNSIEYLNIHDPNSIFTKISVKTQPTPLNILICKPKLILSEDQNSVFIVGGNEH